ncbi:SLC13 family permease [Coraliomargarita parva]|uniref:SLC13 family permease n=1 Tax=Coraliomargarita parva TaxID=3014050 RepID=UPI0022B2CFF0|nr:SLC13 family permease [Coraliomargarita parva]
MSSPDHPHAQKFGTPAESQNTNAYLRQRIGLILGPVLFLVLLLMPSPEGMSAEAQRVAAVAGLMATWWISEAIPIPATSLLPIALFPLLGIMPTPKATIPYANHLIFLFMGGFIIALSMQRWNLHQRIALHVIHAVGFSPNRLVFGFMLATGSLSAFVSNTATAIMMMPIGMAVMSEASSAVQLSGNEQARQASAALGTNLMLGIAYAASIGGLATLIGTPPNTVLAGYLGKTYGYEISFAKWMLVGAPLACLFIPLCWLWLTRFANPMKGLVLPNSREIIEEELQKLGKMSKGERWASIVFGLTALSWIFRPQIAQVFPRPEMIKDATIAMGGAIALFMIPVDWKRLEFVMNWQWAAKLPWGVLTLFGGGLALAQGFDASGLAEWTIDQVQVLESLPILFVIMGIALMVTFLTELTSNTATSTLLMPVLAGIAIGLGQNPLLLLAPAAISASCAFMLPVATPPNAIIFGSGQVTIPQMMRSGFGLNLIGVFLVTTITYLCLIPAFDIVLGELPQWAR